MIIPGVVAASSGSGAMFTFYSGNLWSFTNSGNITLPENVMNATRGNKTVVIITANMAVSNLSMPGYTIIFSGYFTDYHFVIATYPSVVSTPQISFETAQSGKTLAISYFCITGNINANNGVGWAINRDGDYPINYPTVTPNKSGGILLYHSHASTDLGVDHSVAGPIQLKNTRDNLLGNYVGKWFYAGREVAPVSGVASTARSSDGSGVAPAGSVIVCATP